MLNCYAYVSCDTPAFALSRWLTKHKDNNIERNKKKHEEINFV